ncbi:MAG: ribulose-phosphate 3-epimerase [Bacteroidetes bacterium]|nr:MAG: ribulose-phosphate 3-epimerase [Bacteroidota bacterium]
MSHLVAPSLLSADFLRLEEEISMVNRSEADWLHLDIMDGVFVPNISFGFPVLNRIRTIIEKPMDVHLMIVDPDRYLEQFREAGASVITVHYEACTHLHRTIQAIKQTGAKAGVSLNPHTPVILLREIIGTLDLVLLMSVNPGFGGQQFIEQTYRKSRELKTLILDHGAGALIEVDGGVTQENARSLVDAGVDVLVAGNSVFGSPDPIATIHQLKHC